ncbi:Maf family protein [Thioalkalivibrio sp.]|uniref:Maf family protein n=1 Tax=Thioalkalivibrio sp. TaxID=2093813 RepID=UPI0035655866
MTALRTLVLGSTSPYRRSLLERLRIPFETASPGVAEDRLPEETPPALAERLARAKAADVAARYPDALVIGSDQSAGIGERVLSKPGDHQRAAEQLAALSGQSVVFHTGLCLIDTASGREWIGVVPFTVHMRDFDEDEIERYLRLERPYDCSGSFKSEGLGVSLFRRTEGDDPTALVGLPLIRLCAWLREAGMNVPPDRA